MSDIQECWMKLRSLAETATGDPREAAGRIVRDFEARASAEDVGELRRRVEDTLVAGRYTAVPSPYLSQHSMWLAVLEGACGTTAASRWG